MENTIQLTLTYTTKVNANLSYACATVSGLQCDMNPTTDHVHVPEGPITRSKVKKIQEAYTLHLQKLASVPVETRTFEPKNLYSISISNQEDNEVADIGK